MSDASRRVPARTTDVAAGSASGSAAGAAAGVATGVLALGVAILGSSILTSLGLAGGTPSPISALADSFIDLTPAWLKDFAVATFGTADKLALLAGMVLVFAAACAGVGLLARRRLQLALGVFAILCAVVVVAIMTRPRAGVVDVAPTVVGGIVGLYWLSRTFAPRALPPEGLARRQVVAGGVGVAALASGLATNGGGVAAETRRAETALPTGTGKAAVSAPTGASVDVAGVAPWVTPNDDFYRIDTAFSVPRLDTSTWRLRVTGLVEQPVELDWATLVAKPMTDAYVTLTCVSNEVGGDLVGNARWTGWPVRELLALARPQAGADMVLQTSHDGWTASTPLEVLTDERNALLAIAMNGEPLPFEHGYPVRVVVPGLYGYVSATKWVTELRVTTFAESVAYWTERGWAEKGPIKLSSRIDVPRSGDSVAEGAMVLGGVAWAQHTGVERVQVRVDDGPWQDAKLASEPTVDAWRQWSLPFTAARGSHTATVRAVDRRGQVQTDAVANPAPDGATGLHSVTFTVA